MSARDPSSLQQSLRTLPDSIAEDDSESQSQTHRHGFASQDAAGFLTTSAAALRLFNQRSATQNSTPEVEPCRGSAPQDASSTTPAPSILPWATPPPNSFQFRANTTAPSPPTVDPPSGESTPPRVFSDIDDRLANQPTTLAGSSLRIHTDIRPSTPLRNNSLNSTVNLSAASARSSKSASLSLSRKSSAPSLKPMSRTPSLKAGAFGHAFGSASAASSTVPSPVISAMGDVTPLPSPLLSGDSPGPWQRLQARPPSRDASQLSAIMSESVLVSSNGESIAAALANQTKRKAYSGSVSVTEKKDAPKTKIHTRNRSTSEYIPDPLMIPKRMVTVSAGSHIHPSDEPHIRREPNLSKARGLTPVEKPPSPPPSESSLTANEPASTLREKKPRYEYFDAQGRKDGKMRRWRVVRPLGQGTFSRVVLATSHLSLPEDDYEADGKLDTGLLTPEPQSRPDRRSLVAVKVCESGPKGGASEDRVEMSLKRELEIMQSIHHPCLVDLKAWSIEPTRAILVLSYCPGGDLFDVATTHRDLLVPSLLRRLFAELVGAVLYLHEQHIVHRDIKLENVLVNLTPEELADSSVDWQTYPHSVITLTDLGLSRKIADDEKLETRCGSDDYAAPEVIMGQPYDGRATDAWSLGVLLYALLESRLPFDPPPGLNDNHHRMRSRTSHRIARVEWRWIEYAGDDGDHESDIKKFEERGLLGAMEATEGLLKRARSRWPLEKVSKLEWVRNGITIEGGIKFREEKEAEEIS